MKIIIALKNFKNQLPIAVLIFSGILYTTLQLLAIIIVGKLVSTPFGTVSAGSIVAPFWFLTNDMIAEIYGYKISRMVFWSAMIAELIFSLSAIIILQFPSPKAWLGASAFQLVLGHLPLIYFAQLLAIIFAWYFNTKLLLKWKLRMKGGFFWLRSIGSSTIGEIIFSLIAASIIMSGMMSHWQNQSSYMLVIHLVTWSVLLKVTFTAIFTIPASIIISTLKNMGIERDVNIKLNPFRADLILSEKT